MPIVSRKILCERLYEFQQWCIFLLIDFRPKLVIIIIPETTLENILMVDGWSNSN